jgi:hypothetical protein
VLLPALLIRVADTCTAILPAAFGRGAMNRLCATPEAVGLDTDGGAISSVLAEGETTESITGRSPKLVQVRGKGSTREMNDFGGWVSRASTRFPMR